MSEYDYCDNAASLGRSINGEVPSCWDNPVEVTVVIEYDPHGTDYDHLRLCERCAARTERYAESLGFTVSTRKVSRLD